MYAYTCIYIYMIVHLHEHLHVHDFIQFYHTILEGASANVNKVLYCSKVKNLMARLGASAVIGGRMPL